MGEPIKDNHLIPDIKIIMFLILTIILSGAISIRMILAPHSDYYQHIIFAHQIVEQGTTWLSHYFFEQLLLIVRTLIPFNIYSFFYSDYLEVITQWSYQISAWIISVSSFVILIVLIFIRLFVKTGRKLYLFSLALIFLAPISLFSFFSHQMYFGFIYTTVYHNPTQLLLRPLAILSFWIILDNIEKEFSKKSTLITVVLIILSTLTKPNFTIILIPGIIIYTVYLKITGYKVNYLYVGFGVLLPALIILLYQYLITFGSDQERIIFAPFRALMIYVHRRSYLLGRFVLSILYPLTIFLLYFRVAIKNKTLIFTWILFIIGCFYTYFLTQTGNRESHLNFIWCSQIALFILFVESLIFQLSESNTGNKNTIAGITCWTIFALHVISGIIWYCVELISPGMFWGI